MSSEKINAPIHRCGNPSCPNQPDLSPQHADDAAPALQRCTRCRSTAYCSRDCQASSWATHKRRCRRPNYVIRFELHPGKITGPPVARTLSCPAGGDFYTLHLALQLAFGWATTHSFDFAVVNPGYTPPTDIMHVIEKLRLQHTGGGAASEPPEYLLRVTDPVARTQFGGIDRMHEGQRRHPLTRERLADAYKLHQLLDDARWRGKKVVYTYDFGDNWEHFLTVEGRCDPTEEFQVLSGVGDCVAEDVGSLTGWEELKAAYRAASPTPRQKERRGWYENMASNGNPKGLAGDRVNIFENMDEINRNMRLENIWDYFERHSYEHEQRGKDKLEWLTRQRGGRD